MDGRIDYVKCLRVINRGIDSMNVNRTRTRLMKRLAFNKTVDSLALEINNQYREIRGMVEEDILSRQVRLVYCPIQGLWYQPLYSGGIEAGRVWRLAA